MICESQKVLLYVYTMDSKLSRGLQHQGGFERKCLVELGAGDWKVKGFCQHQGIKEDG